MGWSAKMKDKTFSIEIISMVFVHAFSGVKLIANYIGIIYMVCVFTVYTRPRRHDGPFHCDVNRVVSCDITRQHQFVMNSIDICGSSSEHALPNTLIEQIDEKFSVFRLSTTCARFHA